MGFTCGQKMSEKCHGRQNGEIALDCGIWETGSEEPMTRNLAVMPKSYSNCDCVGVLKCLVSASFFSFSESR